MAVTEIIRPAIPIRHTSQAPQKVLKSLQYGMEEEGVPCEFTTASGDAVSIAFEASKGSRFDVAVGVDGTNVVLHHAKFASDKPLFMISTRATDDMLRAIGADAARIVKRLPLKVIDRR